MFLTDKNKRQMTWIPYSEAVKTALKKHGEDA
jgi:hypothetical protein